jgi:hypothetical protein
VTCAAPVPLPTATVGGVTYTFPDRPPGWLWTRVLPPGAPVSPPVLVMQPATPNPPPPPPVARWGASGQPLGPNGETALGAATINGVSFPAPYVAFGGLVANLEWPWTPFAGRL